MSVPLRRAIVDTQTLIANLEVLRATVGADAVVDLRGNAWGHDIGVVGPALRAAGVREVLIDQPIQTVLTDTLGLVGRPHVGSAPDGVLGAELFGLRDDNGDALDAELHPVLSLRAVVVALKHVPAHAGISYGHTYVAATDTTVALVGAGYGDGLPRSASNPGPIALGGHRYRIAGRMAMDALIVDVGEHTVTVGDEAVVFGGAQRDEPTAEEWAQLVGTTSAEIVAGLLPRVAREAI